MDKRFFALLRVFLLYLRLKLLQLFSQTFNVKSMFSEKISSLIVGNVDFVNDELEAKVETLIAKTAALTAAGMKFETLAGEDGKALEAGEALVSLAGELGVAFPNLGSDQAERVKSVVALIFDNPSADLDAAGTEVFNAAVDTVVAAQDLNRYVDGLGSGE